MYRFVVFDMDKTVIPITANEFLGKQLNVEKDIELWEKEYHGNLIDDFIFATRMSKVLKGKKLADIHGHLKSIPKLKDISKTIKYLQNKNISTALITVGPGFVATYLSEVHGFTYNFGTEHIVENGVFTGRVGKVLTDKDKLEKTIHLAELLKIKLEECIAVGDGKSDIPLFENCGFSIALNAKDQTVMKKAKVSIFTESLYDIIPHIIKPTNE